MEVSLYRGSSLIYTVTALDSSYVSRASMGEDTALLEFVTSTAVVLQPGDYCTIFGLYYFVKDQVIPTLDVTRLKYSLKLYSTLYELEKVDFFTFDNTGADQRPEGSYDCTPLQLVSAIVNNLLRVQPDKPWTAGTVLTSEPITIDFSFNNCLEALQSGAEAFDTDYHVENYTIHLYRVSRAITTKPLGYGTGLGITSITANKSADTAIITKLYAYGSATNSPDGQRLEIEPILYPGAQIICEGFKVFDDIYPRAINEVYTCDNSESWLTISLPLYFDINDYGIEGVTPQIQFITGELQGIVFSINTPPPGHKYYLTPVNINGNIVPGTSGFNMSPGDKFEVFNINMPVVCINEAKADLEEAATLYLNEQARMKVKLNIATDEIYLKRNNVTLELFDSLTISAFFIPGMEAGLETFLIGFNRYLNAPFRYTNVICGDVYFERKFSQLTQVINKTIKTTLIQAGGGDKYHKHTQSAPASTWSITHNLNKRPSVVTMDTAGTEVEGEVVYLNENELIINFSAAFSGTADLN